MDRELIIVTPTEAAAYDAVKGLKELDRDGSIELYATQVVTREPNGELALREREVDARAGSAAALGATMGALIGLLAGPVGAAAGAVAGGAATGAVAGATVDIGASGIAADFLHEVASNLQPGSFAVVASVWEDWTAPVDSVASKLGGKVFRHSTHDVAVAQMRAGLDELADEEAYIDQQLGQASDRAKADLSAKRDEIRAKRAERRKRLEARLNEIEKTTDAKIQAIDDKLDVAADEARARHEEHKNKLKRFASAQKASYRELFSSSART